MNPKLIRRLVLPLLPALVLIGAGSGAAAAPSTEGATWLAAAAGGPAAAPREASAGATQESEADKPADRKVKVFVSRGDGEPSEVVIAPEDGGTGDVHAVFVGSDGQVEALPGSPGGPAGFHWRAVSESQPRGYLGVELTDLTSELRAHFGAPEEAGVLVARVDPDSPAAAAGLEVGDVVTALDGERVATSRDVRKKVRGLEDGEALAVEVRRDGRVVDLTATVVRREVPEIDARRFLWRTGEGEASGFAYEVDPEAMSAEVKRLTEHLSGPEFQGRLKNLQVLEGDVGKRLDELEAKLADLERQLAESKAKEKGGS